MELLKKQQDFLFATHPLPLQVKICNLRLVVEDDDNGKFRLERVSGHITGTSGVSRNKLRGVLKFQETIQQQGPMFEQINIKLKIQHSLD